MSDMDGQQKQVPAPYSPPERVEFKKKGHAKAQIPTAAMPDIVFMLLLFFMVTTVFKEFSGLNVLLPSAKQIEKLPTKRHVSYLWINSEGTISIDDYMVEVSQVALVMYNKRVADPQIVVSLKIDQNATMGRVSAVQQELREADALRINYSAKFDDR